ncbi:MAG: S8 family peptidase, partial [candidate division Zixibacteria bacterium]|nr:S8 family peptidase [candidate division Zixibacteria bacterium]
DTGFSLDIDAFVHLHLIATRDFINGDDDVGDGDSAQMSHGTMTLSTCGGLAPGNLIGVAPGAEYVLAKTEILIKEIRVEEDYWVAGLEWADSMGCDLVSSSLGYTDWHTNPSDYDGNTAPATIAADLAAARGLLVVNAAGNGGCDPLHPSLVIPADGDSVLTVGASDFHGAIAGFSSCGPTFDGRIKPDVVAPGVNVRVAHPRSGQYGSGSGTSFATPLVTGVCALLLQKNPSTSPYALIQTLRETATRADTPAIPYGWGLIQAAEAAGIVRVPPIEAWPNPASSKVTIVISYDEAAGENILRVFTVAGQPVFDTTFNSSRVDWYGLTSGRNRVAAGIYLFWVKTSKREDLLKVAWLPNE